MATYSKYTRSRSVFCQIDKYLETLLFLELGAQRWKCILFGDDKFLVLKGDVALDLALVDEVGNDALGLVLVDVLDLHHAQGDQEGVDGDLVGAHEQRHLLEQVPVRGDPQFLQDEVDARLDEELLVGLEGRVEPQ